MAFNRGMTAAPTIDLTSTAAFAAGHPWDQYAWLRANDPVHWHPEVDGPGFWAVTRYDDVRTVSRQPRTFSSYARGVMMAESDDAGLAAQRQMMLSMDPPQHDRFKLLVSRGFTPRNAQIADRAHRGAGAARSSTTSSSAASATSSTTSPAACRRA